MRYLARSFTQAIPLLILTAFLFTGCGAQDPPPSSEASQAGGQSSSIASPGADTSSSRAASSQSEKPSASLEGSQNPLSPPLPKEPLSPVQEGFTGSWMHMAGPYVEGEEKWVYQFRFDEPSGTIMISYGLYGTDAGHYFGGTYSTDGGGIFTASVEPGGFDVPENPPVTKVVFKVEAAAEKSDLLVITLQQMETEDSDFISSFTPLLNLPVTYSKYG